VLALKTLSWLQVLPLVVFENVLPVPGIRGKRAPHEDHRKRPALPLAAWLALAVLFPIATKWDTRARALIAPSSAPRWPPLDLRGCAIRGVRGRFRRGGVFLAVLFAWIVLRAYVADTGRRGACRRRSPAAAIQVDAGASLFAPSRRCSSAP
jgi:hypothetical protein